MKVGIVTVNYNGANDTLELLESFKKLQLDGFEIKKIVVDNGSTDNSFEKLLKVNDIELLQAGINKGFTGGYNKGIEYALAWGADQILIINNDALINSPNLVKHLLETQKKDPKIGIVTPKILFAPGYEFHKDRYSEEEVGKVIWYGGGKFDWNNVMGTHIGIDDVDQGQFDEAKQTEYVSGCCLLLGREFLEDVGVFDDQLFAYMEDSDLMIRSRKKGFKFFYDGEVSIYHKVSQTAGIGSIYTDYYLTRNRLIFGFRYLKFRTKFALLREALKFLLIGRLYQKKGVIDFLKGQTGASSELLKKPEKVQYSKKLSIVTVNYNTAELINNLLISIFNKNSGFDKDLMEVKVLDNGKLDPSEKFVKKFPLAEYLLNEENAGFVGGFNRMLRYSKGEYILMLNSDMEATEGSIRKILETAEEFKGEAIVSGKLLFPDGRIQDSVFFLPTIWGAIKEYFFKVKGAYFMYLPKTDKTIQIEGAVMALYLIPQKILNKMGYLDKNLFSLFEDIEYARRAKKFKVPIYFDPKVVFLHHHGASFKKKGKKWSYDQLVKSSQYYHGKFYYTLLYYTLLISQKFSRTTSPGEFR